VDTSLKQRIIGAAVIVAIAVIFIPMLFDNGDRQKPNPDMDVPPKPKYTFEDPGQAPPAKEQAVDRSAGAKRARATGATNRAKSRHQASAREGPSASDIARSPVSKPLSARAQKRTEDRDQGLASPKTGSHTVWPTEQAHPAPVDSAGKANIATAPTRIAPPDLKGPISNDSPPLPQHGISPKPTDPSVAQTKAASPLAEARPSADVLPSGWAVQVGSFSERDNAMLLLDKLRSSGFTAFQERSASGGEPVFRVKVGPEQNRERAEALQAKLRNQENLPGIVVSQSPDG
jgi:DedD protein